MRAWFACLAGVAVACGTAERSRPDAAVQLDPAELADLSRSAYDAAPDARRAQDAAVDAILATDGPAPDVPGAPGDPCVAACTTLAACGTPLADCPALCAAGDAPTHAALLACLQLPGPGECAPDTVFACLARDVVPGCGKLCAALGACESDLPSSCARDCVQAHASPDPLARQRIADVALCLPDVSATDPLTCAAVADCAAGPARLNEAPASDTFCAAFTACGWDAAGSCRTLTDALSGDVNGIVALHCFYDVLLAPCASGLAAAYDRCLVDAPADLRCGPYCEAVELCGLGAGGPDCQDTCSTLQDTDPDANARQRLRSSCVDAGNCADLEACLAGRGAEGICRAACDTEAACTNTPAANAPESCVPDCLATFGRLRRADWIDCLTAAPPGECVDIRACALAPAPPCAEACAREAECGLPTPAACEADCDNQYVDYPDVVAARLGCDLAAPVCAGAADGFDVAACQESSSPGRACTAYCRARPPGDCADRPVGGDLDCLAACGRGFAPPESSVFGAAEVCLLAAGDAPPCKSLAGCLPTEPVDCAAFCARASECGLAPPDCVASCLGDPLGALRSASAGACVAAAPDCAAVAMCLDPRLAPTPPDDHDAFCAAWNTCGYARTGGPCDAAVDALSASGIGAVPCAITRMSGGCEDTPFPLQIGCMGGPPLAACRLRCEAESACNPDGPSTLDCLRACAAAPPAPEDPCAAAFDCATFSSCNR